MAAALPIHNVSSGQARAEEVLRDAEEALPVLFPVQAPRDVLGGLWSGIKCVLGGVLVGLAGLIAQPIEGAREEGVVGCFRGVGLGLLAGLFFAITGLCTGVFQTLRGVAATPRAICMAGRGWHWDAQNGTWTEPKAYSLLEEAEEVLVDGEPEPSETAERNDRTRPTRVADTFYYDQLGVATDASQQEIRRAYIQRSRQCHPDKTSEENAKERFQSISEAYQVLSDKQRRRNYDLHGRDGKGEGFIDAKVFFDVLLGADALAPYVGRLRITEVLGQELFSGSGEDQSVSQQTQTRREVKLAISLASRLDAMHGPQALQEAKDEASGILQRDPSLARFLMEIGWVYANRADVYLASSGSLLGSWSVSALSSRASGHGHQASQQMRTAKLAAHSFVKLRRIVKEADEKEGGTTSASTGEELPESLSSALPTFMETFWSLSSHDITGTLDKVIGRVLSDGSVSLEERGLRAERLRELGQALQELTAQATTSETGPQGTAECRRFEKADRKSVV